MAIGHAGPLANFARVNEAFDDLSYVVEDVFDAGDRVVVFVRMRARAPRERLTE